MEMAVEAGLLEEPILLTDLLDRTFLPTDGPGE
jgi:hypothetical protein